MVEETVSIDEMPAGREMEGLVAEKVMGWERCIPTSVVDRPVSGVEHGVGTPPEPCKENCRYVGIPGPKPRAVFPYYSTDIGAAWEVVEKMKDNQNKSDSYGFSWNVELYYMGNEHESGKEWSCILHGPAGSREGLGSTAPLAICRAALKAVL